MKNYIWIILLMIVLDTQAVTNVFVPGDCVNCLASSKYAGVCQSKYSQFISYCCTAADMDRHSACYASPMCSQKIDSVDMRASSCPFHKKKCGNIPSPTIQLTEGSPQRVKINKNSAFQEDDICHYTITTDSQIIPRNIDIKKRKYINLWFDYFEGVDVFVSNATSLEQVGYRSVVSYTNRNFTQPNTQQYYIVVKPKAGSQWSDYVMDFTVKYYEFDPACPKFTEFNGITCVANYVEYCESLTPLFISQTGDDRTKVVYDGKSCVVQVPDGVDCDKNPQNEQCKSIDCKSTPNAPQCQVIVNCTATPDLPECVVETADCKLYPNDPTCTGFERPKIEFGLSETDRKLRQPGKDQLAITIAMICITVGIGSFICIDRYKKKQDDAKIDPYDIIQQQEELYKRKLKFNKDNVIDISDDSEQELNNASESTIGDKLMVPEMNNTPQRRGSKNDGVFPSLGSDRMGSAISNFDVEDDISSRPGSVYSNYNTMNATSLNAALSHHLHFETVQPFSNSRAKKKRGKNLFGTKGSKREKNVSYGFDAANSAGSLEETERNQAMKQLASMQHGNIIRDESTRIKEGAAELGTDQPMESERLLASDRVDFNPAYKYTPQDNKVKAIQPIIEEEKQDDEWELEDAEEVPLANKSANITIEVEPVVPEPSEKESEKPPLNFHRKGASSHTIKVDESKDVIEDAISHIEQVKDDQSSAMNNNPMVLPKKDMNKTFQVQNPDLMEPQENNIVSPRANTNMSVGPKDESSGNPPKSSNQSEDQSALMIPGTKVIDQESESTIKIQEAPKAPLINKDMITKAYQAEVTRQMEENKRKLALFAKKGGKGADDLLRKIQEMKKGKKSFTEDNNEDE